MLASKLSKILVSVSLFCSSSCGFLQTSSNSNNAGNTQNISEIQSSIPFSTKEPEVFQAEIVTINDGEEERLFIARSGGNVFTKQNELGTLHLAVGKTLSIDFRKKIYTEVALRNGPSAIPAEETLNDFLTTEWLNQKSDVLYESLGTEGGLMKYKVSFAAAESVVFVDENYKIPVRQEFYSIDGGTKSLVYSIELQNIKLIADEQLFVVPTDFRKVSADEFRQD